jgi:hypothetical protein
MIYDDQTSSAMNYYEELGVSPEATEQEIRKAHRRLVKLMHPDAQPDQSKKMLAETQMRLLNSIVSTLLDSDQRREYDDELKSAQSPRWQDQEGGSSWRGIPWWLASTAGAVVLTLAAVWLWADHVGNTFGRKPSHTMVIQSAENRPASSISPAPPIPSANDTDPVGASYTAPVVPPSVATALPAPPSETKSSMSTAVVNDPRPTDLQLKQEKPTDKPVEKPNPVVVTLPSKAKKLEPLTVKPKPVIAATNRTLPSAANKSLPPPVKSGPDAKAVKPLAETLQAHSSAKNSRMTVTKPALNTITVVPPSAKQAAAAAHKRVFSMPAGSLVAQVMPSSNPSNSLLPVPPHVSTQGNHDDNISSVPSSPLPSAVPPPGSTVTTSASPAGVAPGNSRDPLEGEWVYAPKEPERQRAGFYPPEFIDLRLFEAGDPGNLRGQYSAKYLVTDHPVSSEVSFQLMSVSKGSRRFLWQGNNGSRGTLNIDPIDERTIRVDWHTTSAVRGPALTSGQATLVRRQ